MAVKKHTPLDYAAANLGGAQFSIFICDTTAELPNGVAPMQFRKGDLAITNDANNVYVASSSTTWKLIGAGSALTPATTVVSGTGFALSPAVGSSMNYAREDHGHGSVGHDSHTLLSGISADQHHLELHGSAKHTGGIVTLQDEGAGAGSVATVNFVGAGVTASVAGTVGTVTIPGGGAGVPTAFAAKSADQPRTSSTATADVTDMVVPLLANEVWRGTLNLLYTSLSAGLVVSWSVPAGCTIAWGPDSSYDTNSPAVLLTASDTFLLSVSASGTVSLESEIRYRITNGANAGNAQLRMAASVNSVNPCTLRRDSSLMSVRLR